MKQKCRNIKHYLIKFTKFNLVLYRYLIYKYVQWKPLNLITLGQRESDDINRMITISDLPLIKSTYLLVMLDLVNLRQFDHINIMITLSVITLSGLHYT
jgi:hypothetical protein